MWADAMSVNNNLPKLSAKCFRLYFSMRTFDLLQCGVLASRYCLAQTLKIIGRLSAWTRLTPSSRSRRRLRSALIAKFFDPLLVLSCIRCPRNRKVYHQTFPRLYVLITRSLRDRLSYTPSCTCGDCPAVRMRS